MASTTLVTFMMQTPPSIVNVDLFGSWDNFSKPYPMKPDVRVGHGHWRGCHSFTNIICDGDAVFPAHGRDGCLKMGGLYWYFYQLNGYTDYHNSAEPSTTSCPFLPGQVLNILEVPTQTDTQGRCESASSSASTPFTLNPEDKYLKPRSRTQDTPPKDKISIPPKASLVHEDGRNGKEPAIFDVLDADRLIESLNELVPRCGHGFAPQPPSRFQSRSEPVSRQSQNSSDLAGLRHIRSEGKASFGHGSNGSPFILNGCPRDSFTKSRSMVSVSAPLWPTNLSVPVLSGFNERLAVEGHSDVPETHNYLSEDLLRFEDLLLSPKDELDSLSMILDGWDITQRMEYQDSRAHGHRLSTKEDPTSTVKLDQMNSELLSHVRRPHAGLDAVSNMYTVHENIDESQWHNSSSVYSSVRSSQMISPSLSCSTAWTGCLSPVHLGQPSTPQAKDFEIPNLESKRPSKSSQTFHLTRKEQELRSGTQFPETCRFSGYHLPEADYTSVLTLRNLAPATLHSPSVNSQRGQKIGHERAQPWNDGAPFEDNLHDLSYLGGVII